MLGGSARAGAPVAAACLPRLSRFPPLRRGAAGTGDAPEPATGGGGGWRRWGGRCCEGGARAELVRQGQGSGGRYAGVPGCACSRRCGAVALAPAMRGNQAPGAVAGWAPGSGGRYVSVPGCVGSRRWTRARWWWGWCRRCAGTGRGVRWSRRGLGRYEACRPGAGHRSPHGVAYESVPGCAGSRRWKAARWWWGWCRRCAGTGRGVCWIRRGLGRYEACRPAAGHRSPHGVAYESVPGCAGSRRWKAARWWWGWCRRCAGTGRGVRWSRRGLGRYEACRPAAGHRSPHGVAYESVPGCAGSRRWNAAR